MRYAKYVQIEAGRIIIHKYHDRIAINNFYFLSFLFKMNNLLKITCFVVNSHRPDMHAHYHSHELINSLTDNHKLW